MFICVTFSLKYLNETRIQACVSRRQVCRGYIFLVGYPIEEKGFRRFNHTWRDYVKNKFLKKVKCEGMSWIYAAKGRVNLLAVVDSNKFYLQEHFFFTICATDRLPRMLCCTELVGCGKVNKTGFRSLSRYKHFILLFSCGSTHRPIPDITQHSKETNIHAPGGIRNYNPSSRAAADLRLLILRLLKLKVHVK
jgi:hypothetical protein